MKYFHAASRLAGVRYSETEQHGRKRRALQRDPQDAHVVRQQREQHGEIEELVHAVIEPQPAAVSRPFLCSIRM
jgi:hypothetical protein